MSLVIGGFGGKEFSIVSEGNQDPTERANEWYERITKQMEKCKQAISAGVTRKKVVNPGFDPVPLLVNPNAAAVAAGPPLIDPNQAAAALAASAAAAAPPIVQTPASSPFVAPVASFSSPLPTTSLAQTSTISPIGLGASGTITCVSCQKQFTNTGGALVSCPYCGFLNSSAAPPNVGVPAMSAMPTGILSGIPTATVIPSGIPTATVIPSGIPTATIIPSAFPTVTYAPAFPTVAYAPAFPTATVAYAPAFPTATVTYTPTFY